MNGVMEETPLGIPMWIIALAIPVVVVGGGLALVKYISKMK